jgi:hypothetical protein
LCQTSWEERVVVKRDFDAAVGYCCQEGVEKTENIVPAEKLNVTWIGQAREALTDTSVRTGAEEDRII